MSTLDLLSHGRVEMGIGEGASTTELHPFDVRFRDKRAVWEDAVKALMPMFTSEAWEYHGGYEIELQGDGFLLAFDNAHQGLLCAIEIQRVFRPYNAEHADEPILVRIGLHTGEALREKDKFFGLTEILAARIAGQA